MELFKKVFWLIFLLGTVQNLSAKSLRGKNRRSLLKRTVEDAVNEAMDVQQIVARVDDLQDSIQELRKADDEDIVQEARSTLPDIQGDLDDLKIVLYNKEDEAKSKRSAHSRNKNRSSKRSAEDEVVNEAVEEVVKRTADDILEKVDQMEGIVQNLRAADSDELEATARTDLFSLDDILEDVKERALGVGKSRKVNKRRTHHKTSHRSHHKRSNEDVQDVVAQVVEDLVAKEVSRTIDTVLDEADEIEEIARDLQDLDDDHLVVAARSDLPYIINSVKHIRQIEMDSLTLGEVNQVRRRNRKHHRRTSSKRSAEDAVGNDADAIQQVLGRAVDEAVDDAVDKAVERTINEVLDKLETIEGIVQELEDVDVDNLEELARADLPEIQEILNDLKRMDPSSDDDITTSATRSNRKRYRKRGSKRSIVGENEDSGAPVLETKL